MDHTQTSSQLFRGKVVAEFSKVGDRSTIKGKDGNGAGITLTLTCADRDFNEALRSVVQAERNDREWNDFEKEPRAKVLKHMRQKSGTLTEAKPTRTPARAAGLVRMRRTAGSSRARRTCAVARSSENTTPNLAPPASSQPSRPRMPWLSRRSTAAKRQPRQTYLSRFSGVGRHSAVRTKVKQAKGLRNLGNTCYLNAVLCCILHLPPVVRALGSDTWVETAQRAKREGEGGAGVPTVFLALIDLLREKLRSSGVLSPRSFQSAMAAKQQRFANNLQQDAHEFLSAVVNEVQEELRPLLQYVADSRDVLPPSVPGAALSSGAAASRDSDANAGAGAGAEEGSVVRPAELEAKRAWSLSSLLPITQSMHMEVEVTLACTNCQFSRSRSECFRDLSLETAMEGEDADDSRAPVSLTMLLDSYFSDQVLELKCGKCPTSNTVKASYRITALPRVLVIHLKRFRPDMFGSYRKIRRRVVFEHELTIDSWSSRRVRLPPSLPSDENLRTVAKWEADGAKARALNPLPPLAADGASDAASGVASYQSSISGRLSAVSAVPRKRAQARDTPARSSVIDIAGSSDDDASGPPDPKRNRRRLEPREHFASPLAPRPAVGISGAHSAGKAVVTSSEREERVAEGKMRRRAALASAMRGKAEVTDRWASGISPETQRDIERRRSAANSDDQLRRAVLASRRESHERDLARESPTTVDDGSASDAEQANPAPTLSERLAQHRELTPVREGGNVATTRRPSPLGSGGSDKRPRGRTSVLRAPLAKKRAVDGQLHGGMPSTPLRQQKLEFSPGSGESPAVTLNGRDITEDDDVKEEPSADPSPHASSEGGEGTADDGVRGDGWACRACTFLNGPLVLMCSMCGTQRTSGSTLRAGSPVDAGGAAGAGAGAGDGGNSASDRDSVVIVEDVGESPGGAGQLVVEAEEDEESDGVDVGEVEQALADEEEDDTTGVEVGCMMDDPSTRYRLQCIVRHHGHRAFEGHYTALVKGRPTAQVLGVGDASGAARGAVAGSGASPASTAAGGSGGGGAAADSGGHSGVSKPGGPEKVDADALWYAHDDSIVSAMTAEQVIVSSVQREAYILFYNLVEPVGHKSS